MIKAGIQAKIAFALAGLLTLGLAWYAEYHVKSQAAFQVNQRQLREAAKQQKSDETWRKTCANGGCDLPVDFGDPNK